MGADGSISYADATEKQFGELFRIRPKERSARAREIPLGSRQAAAGNPKGVFIFPTKMVRMGADGSISYADATEKQFGELFRIRPSEAKRAREIPLGSRQAAAGNPKGVFIFPTKIVRMGADGSESDTDATEKQFVELFRIRPKERSARAREVPLGSRQTVSLGDCV